MYQEECLLLAVRLYFIKCNKPFRGSKMGWYRAQRCPEPWFLPSLSLSFPAVSFGVNNTRDQRCLPWFQASGIQPAMSSESNLLFLSRIPRLFFLSFFFFIVFFFSITIYPPHPPPSPQNSSGLHQHGATCLSLVTGRGNETTDLNGLYLPKLPAWE